MSIRSYKVSRRSFLYGLGAATGIKWWLQSAESQAQDATAPVKRFLHMHRGVGTYLTNWVTQGTETNFTLSPILQPFAPVQDKMVVIHDVDLNGAGAGGAHEKATVQLVTGLQTQELWPGNGGDDPKPEGPSFDQLLVESTPSLGEVPVPTVQVACNETVEGDEYSCRRLSYTHAGHEGIAPALHPLTAYRNLFGAMSANPVAVEQAMAENASVLDYSLQDLSRLRAVAPTSARERFDAHEAAIRALEQKLQVDTGLCSGPEPEDTPLFADKAGFEAHNGGLSGAENEIHAKIGELHFDVIMGAFRCDLTRTANFMWSPGTSGVAFQGWYKDDPNSLRAHHDVSHDGSDPDARWDFITKAETYYAENTSKLIQKLAETDDPVTGGKLLDTTLVLYTSEVSEGPSHSFTNLPLLVFGGDGVGVQGGRVKRYGGFNAQGKMNNIWLTIAKAMGSQMTSFGTPGWSDGPLDFVA